MEFLRAFLRRHFAGKPAVVARNVGCFLRPIRCFFSSNGRAVLYRTGGLLHWKTVSLNIIMKENDVIGCGFERNEDQSANGLVYFTCNGDRLAGDLDGVQSGLWPVIHIQKKVRNIQELRQ